ncbi:ABC transporter permease [Prauserella marina]|uniref:Sulfonate transport system permease protein n=1 Tax=Prauserella marina TaxID=530584 RepID=A0A222VR27_9PSEU|nr:ABC transporter permease [Prauserella marina]ASR36376.1 ABC transporter permease [Prauserella marina]PWV77176.1 sulfonate transport system permease protein [Prauserella marina]SDD06171.1 sulfonate transport system permease protein [Prauserella marina]
MTRNLAPSAEDTSRTGRPPSPPPRGSSAPGRSRRLVPRPLKPIGLLFGPVVVLVVWEMAATVGWLSPRQLAAPSVAVRTATEMLFDGELLPHLGASAQRAYLALAIGIVVGLVLALVSGLSRIGEASIDGLVQIKRAIPTLALIPLAILWLGIGEEMKVAVIAASVFVPIYLNTHAALRGIDLRHVELARSVGLGRADFVRRVALPGALPGFFTGLRLSVTMCWTALVVLEQINATEGIGYLMTKARDYGQTDVIVVGLVIYAVLGLASDFAVRLIERKTLSWRKTIGS